MSNKAKKVFRKVIGGILVVVGAVIGYEGLHIFLKKDYARAYINIDGEATD